MHNAKIDALAVFTAVLTGCGVGGGPGPSWAGTVDTLANGAVVVHSPEDGLWEEGQAWRLVEDLRIGTTMGTGPELFARIIDIEVDDYGRIWVLDRDANQLRVFSADGHHVRTIGREGGGPGEFQGPVGMAWDAEGNLWVADPSNGRYSVFDTTGAFVTSHHRPIGGYSVPWPGGIDETGRLYDVAFSMDGSVILRFDSTMTAVDTVPLPKPDEDSYFTLTTESSRMRVTVAFAAVMRTLIDPRGYVWFGLTDEYRIIQRSFAGDTVRIVEREYEPVHVTDTERGAALDGYDWFTRQGGDVDESRIPDVKPAYDRVFIDTEGYLWVVPSLPPDLEDFAIFDVFDPQGRYLGRVRSTTSISGRPVILEDAIYAVSPGDLGVPFVVRLRIKGRDI